MNRFTAVIKKYIALVLSVCILAAFLCACSSDSAGTGENEYYVYYSNSGADSVIFRTHTLSDEGAEDLYAAVTELFTEMFDTDYTESSCYSAKPEDVAVNYYSISEEGVLSIDFSDEYLSMSLVQEIILRSAIVLTVIQVDGINAVDFYVDGESVVNSDGEAIGEMTAEDFVNVLLNEEGMLQQEADLTLMFANEAKDALIPVTYHFEISNNNMSMEEYVLTMLIEGPGEESGAYATIASDVELISVSTNNHVCYVNFGQSFLEQEQPVSDTLLIYSIVNSLCRLSSVSSVQFLIDGEPATTLHQVTDISSPFTRDYSLENLE